MKSPISRTTLLCLCLCLAPLTACSASESPAADASETAAASESATEAGTLYALGVMLAQNVAPFDLSAEELAEVMRGLEDAVTGAELEVDLASHGPQLQQLAQERMSRAAAAEGEAGTAFVAEQAALADAERTESGLVFTRLTAGDGASPAVTDTVRVHYHGTLRDGTVFDSSVDRGQPVEFSLGQVIPCWQEGLQKMQAGGKAKLVCPSAIAYGDQGRPPTIPGGAVLVFEVELLDVTTAG